jgi:hypothetical protein
MAIQAFEGHQGALNACWPANACKNRMQWLSMAEGLAKQFADAACRKALAGAVSVARSRPAPVGGFAAFIESLVLSALPDGNHGEIYAKGRSV